MHRWISGLVMTAAAVFGALAPLGAQQAALKPVWKHTMTSIDGKSVPLSRYRGKVLLIVNTASQCGLTPQYAGLQALYNKYRKQGLEILAFPANDFGAQEPGTDQQIKVFCTTKYNVTFPLFSKISVKGDTMHPLYRYLTAQQTAPRPAGEIEWNFAKFLISRKGEVVARFASREDPQSPEIVAAIERELKAAK